MAPNVTKTSTSVVTTTSGGPQRTTEIKQRTGIHCKQITDQNENVDANLMHIDEGGYTLKAVDETTTTVKYVSRMRWPDFFVQTFIHLGAVYGLYLLFHVKFLTILWCKYVCELLIVLTLLCHMNDVFK